MEKKAKILNRFDILEFFSSFFMIENWFRTKKYSCNFLQKSIVKKIQIGSNTILLLEMKIMHICNFLTITFYENLKEYFFVRNQFLIIKKGEKTIVKKKHIWSIICLIGKITITENLPQLYLLNLLIFVKNYMNTFLLKINFNHKK